MRTCAACAMFYYIIRFYGRPYNVHNGLIKSDLVTVFSTAGVPRYKERDTQDMLVLPWLVYSCALLDLVLIYRLLMPVKQHQWTHHRKPPTILGYSVTTLGSGKRHNGLHPDSQKRHICSSPVSAWKLPAVKNLASKGSKICLHQMF